MGTLLEMGVDTINTLVVARQAGEKIFIPRTSLAIFNGLRCQFPGEIKERGENEALSAISYLSPVLIALNEMADIGISVYQMNETDEGSKVMEKMQKYLQAWREKFLEKFPGHKATISELINDFCLLSLLRNSIETEQVPIWLELDSAIFEDACYRVATPECLRTESVSQPQTFEDLEKRYGDYLIWGDTEEKQGNKKRGLHGMEMLLKVADDRVGEADDMKLGLPNFVRYAESVSNGRAGGVDEVLKNITEVYRKAAIDGGISAMSTRITQVLCHGSSLVKGYWAGVKSGGSRQPYWESLPKTGEITTVLRHTLFRTTDFAGLLR